MFWIWFWRYAFWHNSLGHCSFVAKLLLFLTLIIIAGYLLLRCSSGNGKPPTTQQLPWPQDKPISSMCFDPTVTWLLVLAEDATLLIIPALPIMVMIMFKWWSLELYRFLSESFLAIFLTIFLTIFYVYASFCWSPEL